MRNPGKLFATAGAFRFYLGLSLVLGIVAVASFALQFDERMPGGTYDWMVKHRFSMPQADPDIVIVDIDEKSLAQMSAEFGRWPWPRDIFAAALAELESQQAKAIVFDILFSDPDRQNPAADRSLVDAVARSNNSYFPVLRLNPSNDAISTIMATGRPGLIVPMPEPGLTPQADRTLALVFPYFASAVAQQRFGTFNVAPDADGVIRHQSLWESIDGWRIVSLPARLAHAFGWPLPEERHHLVRWMGKPLAYKTVSFSDVYFDSQKKNKTRPANEFSGKIVLIGSTAPGLSDLKGTALTSIHPGVDILATGIDNVKNRQVMQEMPGWMRLAATIGLLLLATVLTVRYSGWRHAFAFASIPCVLFLLSWLSLSKFNTFIDLMVSAVYVVAYFIIVKLHEFYLMRKEKEVAESANLAKSRFLAAASHDLRQPMHTISLLVGLLRAQDRDPEANNIIGKIHASVQSMGGMFGSLLDISKFDAGAVDVNVQEFAVDDLLHRLAANYEAQAVEKNLVLKIVPSRAWIRSDPALLERILGNLVSNAIRYTERGKVLVGCRRRQNRLVVQVWDTGIGIDQAQHDRIFEEFFQVANPECDRNKGLGLGLSIVKRSAALLGHKLGLRSAPGKGTTFSIELPLIADNDRRKALAVPVQRPDSLLAQAFIVVIDDGAENREATEAVLRHWGCHVVGAGSAADAMAALQGHLRTPDLIISDYRLRDGIDGVMTIEEIRNWVEQPIPAIVVTGDLAADGGRMSSLGIALLHKPVDSMRLQRLAEGLLRGGD